MVKHRKGEKDIEGFMSERIPPSSSWLTVDGAAELMQVHSEFIYDACRRGELRHSRIGKGRNIRIKSEWIDEDLESKANS